MAGTSIVVSIVLGFLFGELTGWLTGGLVAPGYLALYVDQPLRIVMTYAGICMGALLDAVVGWLPPTGSDLRAIGYVVPGLIANDTWKQGPWKTLLASLVITLATRVVLLLFMH